MIQRRDKLNAASAAQVAVHFQVLRELIGSSREFRAQIQKRQAALLERVEADDTVSAVDVELVLEAAHWFIELDALLYELWTSYRRYLPNGSEPDPYAPFRAATLLSDSVRAKGGLIALSAEMVRMENAMLVVKVLGDGLVLSHWLNRGDPARGIEPESYDRIVGGLYDPSRRRLLHDFLVAVERHQETLSIRARDDGEIAFLLGTLARSKAAKAIRGESTSAREARFVGAMASRTGAALLSPALDIYISRFQEADAADDVDVGRLERIDQIAMRVEESLRPFDIVMVRDVRRPGAAVGYSHALVYLGRFDQWIVNAPHDDVNYAPVAASLRQGDRFLELAADGPRFVDLDSILLAQELVILRAARRDENTREPDYKLRSADLLRALFEDDVSRPSQRPAPDYSALLLERVYGRAMFDLDDTPGHSPNFRRLISASVQETSKFDVVIAAFNGKLLDDNESKRILREELLRRSPLFLRQR